MHVAELFGHKCERLGGSFLKFSKEFKAKGRKIKIYGGFLIFASKMGEAEVGKSK